MAEGSAPELRNARPLAGALARLAARRLALAIAALVLIVLAATGQATWLGALIAFLASLAVSALPLSLRVARDHPAPEPSSHSGHLAGVLDFAAALPDPCF